jgi:hypothetical protein
MHSYRHNFQNIFLCTVFLFLPLASVHAQDTPSSAEQKQQERMETKRLKTMADNLRQNTALSKEEKNYLFRLSMRKMMMKKMRQSGEKMWEWEPTEWQKTLPPIVVQEGEVIREYSFTELIESDGYLCPGSARAYKALQVALPILYENSTPIKGDFKITHGASMCTSLVYDFFMEGYTDNANKKFLERDTSLQKKIISVERLSTGKKVTVVFAPSEVRGHDKAAALAGDKILRAQKGQGMKVYVEGE